MMNYDLLLCFAILFLLPIFPMSIGVNFLLSKLKGKILLVTLMLMFSVGLYLLKILDNEVLVAYISIFALLGNILYAFRMLSVSTATTYVVFYYTLLCGFAWILKFIEADRINFLIEMSIPLFVFALLVSFLDKQFGTTHYRMFRGLGTHMPRLSLVLIMSIFTLILSPFLSGFGIFILKIEKFTILYLSGVMIIWVFLTWSGLRLIEKLIYGIPSRKLRYNDISVWVTAGLSGVLLLNVVASIFFSEVG